MWPLSASGRNLINPSTRPKPARRIGTITIDCDKAVPDVFFNGVCIERPRKSTLAVQW